MTIELPDELAAALKAKAMDHGVSLADFARHVLEEAAEAPAGQKPKKSGYGMLARYGPGPSEEEIDEDRREIFRGFAQDAP